MPNVSVKVILELPNQNTAKIIHKVLNVENKIKPKKINLKQTLQEHQKIIFEIRSGIPQINSIKNTVDDYLFTLKLVLNIIETLSKIARYNLK